MLIEFCFVETGKENVSGDNVILFELFLLWPVGTFHCIYQAFASPIILV